MHFICAAGHLAYKCHCEYCVAHFHMLLLLVMQCICLNYYCCNHFTTLCPGLPRWVGTRRINHSGFCWSRHDGVAVASAEPYASYLHFAALICSASLLITWQLSLWTDWEIRKWKLAEHLTVLSSGERVQIDCSLRATTVPTVISVRPDGSNMYWIFLFKYVSWHRDYGYIMLNYCGGH